MCIKVVEQYAVCHCIYFTHAIDRCSAYDIQSHRVETKEIQVRGTCPRHLFADRKDNLKPQQPSQAGGARPEIRILRERNISTASSYQTQSPRSLVKDVQQLEPSAETKVDLSLEEWNRTRGFSSEYTESFHQYMPINRTTSQYYSRFAKAARLASSIKLGMLVDNKHQDLEIDDENEELMEKKNHGDARRQGVGYPLLQTRPLDGGIPPFRRFPTNSTNEAPDDLGTSEVVNIPAWAAAHRRAKDNHLPSRLSFAENWTSASKFGSDVTSSKEGVKSRGLPTSAIPDAALYGYFLDDYDEDVETKFGSSVRDTIQTITKQERGWRDGTAQGSDGWDGQYYGDLGWDSSHYSASNLGQPQSNRIEPSIKGAEVVVRNSATPPPVISYFRASFGYERRDEKELNFRKGDIQTINQDFSGWWYGISNNIRGWFPSSYGTDIDSTMNSGDTQEKPTRETFKDDIINILDTKINAEEHVGAPSDTNPGIESTPGTRTSSTARKRTKTGCLSKEQLSIILGHLMANTEQLVESVGSNVVRSGRFARIASRANATVRVTLRGYFSSIHKFPIHTWTGTDYRRSLQRRIRGMSRTKVAMSSYHKFRNLCRPRPMPAMSRIILPTLANILILLFSLNIDSNFLPNFLKQATTPHCLSMLQNDRLPLGLTR